MNNLISQLFKKVNAEDEQFSINAITDLCCILEMNSWNLSIEDREVRFGTYISQEVMESQIHRQDEKRIIDFFYNEIVNGHKFSCNMIIAMGHASCRVALKPLIDVLEKTLDRFDENEFYQAITSLERLLFFDETMTREEARGIICQTKLLNFLCKKMLTIQPVLHSDLNDSFGRFLARMILLLDREYSKEI